MLTHKQRRNRRKEIAQAVKRGKLSISQVTNKFQVTAETVRIACIEFGVSPPSQMNNRIKFTSFQVIALKQKGLSYCQIAKRINVSHQRVHQIVSSARNAGVSGLGAAK